MAKYIKKKDLKNAIDECTWYHIGKGGELVEGANSYEHEPLYKYSDIKEIIKNLPTRKFETEPKRTALSKALKWTYGDEPSDSEKPNNSTISKMEQVDKDINVRSKDCETCKHYKLACELFSEICKYEPTTQTETQNSNLTFEKDECAKEYEELGLKELKELIEADRKTEPNNSKVSEIPTGSTSSKMEQVDEPQTCDNCKLKDTTKWCNNQVVCRAYKPMDEPQTDCAWR